MIGVVWLFLRFVVCGGLALMSFAESYFWGVGSLLLLLLLGRHRHGAWR